MMEWKNALTFLWLKEDENEVPSEEGATESSEDNVLSSTPDSVENVENEQSEEGEKSTEQETATDTGEETGTETEGTETEADQESEAENTEFIQLIEEVQTVNENLGQIKQYNVLLIACLGLCLGVYIIRFLFDGLRDKT